MLSLRLHLNLVETAVELKSQMEDIRANPMYWKQGPEANKLRSKMQELTKRLKAS